MYIAAVEFTTSARRNGIVTHFVKDEQVLVSFPLFPPKRETDAVAIRMITRGRYEFSAGAFSAASPTRRPQNNYGEMQYSLKKDTNATKRGFAGIRINLIKTVTHVSHYSLCEITGLMLITKLCMQLPTFRR